mmetsp:Transcript_34863/g.81472  ORF Transcript_34863/g.81472 Transcript_34863/m.81472 type:complete len:350 (+) Transcript_34863:78-1127(+)
MFKSRISLLKLLLCHGIWISVTEIRKLAPKHGKVSREYTTWREPRSEDTAQSSQDSADCIKNSRSSVDGTLGEATNSLHGVRGYIANKVSDVAKCVANSVYGIWSHISYGITDTSCSISNGITCISSKTANGINCIRGHVANGITCVSNCSTNRIDSIWGCISDGIGCIASSIPNSAHCVAQGIAHTVERYALGDASSELKGIFSTIGNTLADAFEDIGNRLQNAEVDAILKQGGPEHGHVEVRSKEDGSCRRYPCRASYSKAATNVDACGRLLLCRWLLHGFYLGVRHGGSNRHALHYLRLSGCRGNEGAAAGLQHWDHALDLRAAWYTCRHAKGLKVPCPLRSVASV